MDPVSALGLAANVIQFVDFSLNLVGAGCAIAKSIHGATESTIELEKTYTTLKAFSFSLVSNGNDPNLLPDGAVGDGTARNPVGKTIKAHATALEEIAADCEAVCDQLLLVVRDLKVKKGASIMKIRAFAAAFKSVLKAKKISGLEERLRRFQTLIALHFFPLLREQQSHMLQTLDELQSRSKSLNLDQATRFDELSTRLQTVIQKIDSIPREEAAHPTEGAPDHKKGKLKHVQTKKLYGPRKVFYPTDIGNLDEILSDLTLTDRDLTVTAREQVMLESLNFESRPYRHDDIPAAHRSTFEWLFSDQQSNSSSIGQDNLQPHSAFLKWLKSGNGTFWVSGKAGAGKSTLMKFVVSHYKMWQSLREWAGSRRVVVAAHYFWSTGTTMQKSLRGLLQALLFDILRRCPGLAAEIFPERWKLTGPTSLGSTKHVQWSVNELLRGLRILAQHRSLPVRCCLFIDGLDEFDGDHYELCQLLKELSSSENIKCCVSSRPWNVFQDAFADDASHSLCVHDLTQEDIRKYTESRLLEDFRKWRHVGFGDEEAASFVKIITDRAQGVFLWVYLVIRALRDGLVNGDTIYDLRKRLEALPSDLEPFFKHMLDLVDVFYHQYMGRTLQMAMNATEPLDLATYYAREFEERDEDYALTQTVEPRLTPRNMSPQLLDPCARRINARCGGILVFKSNRVVFLHRTVQDFLLTAPMQEYLKQKAGLDYKVNLSTLKAFAFQFRCILTDASSLENIPNMKMAFQKVLDYADAALREDEKAAMTILDKSPDIYEDHALTSRFALRSAVDEIYQDQVVQTVRQLRHTVRELGGDGEAENSAYVHPPVVPRLRHAFLRGGIYKYVENKLRENPRYFDNENQLSLIQVIEMYKQWKPGHVRIISLLLDAGQDPNGFHPNEVILAAKTPWRAFLDKFIDDHPSGRQGRLKLGAPDDIFTIFLRNGANASLEIPLGIGTRQILTQIVLRWPTDDRFSQQMIRMINEFLARSGQNARRQVVEFLDVVLHPREPYHTPTTRQLARAMEPIVSKGLELEIDMESHVPSIEHVFGHYGALLVAMVRAGPDRVAKPSSDVALAKRPAASDMKSLPRKSKRLKR